MYKNGVNFNVNGSIEQIIDEYIGIVCRSINENIDNTNYFVNSCMKLN
jgi:hypothetical protein